MVNEATFSAGDVLKEPFKPEDAESIVAMNCVLSPAEAENVASGLDIQPWPLTTDAVRAEASRHR